MEFNFNINHLLGDTITKLDCNVSPSRRNADGLNHACLRSQLFTVIDRMGELSSQAQGLYSVITTGRKLQYSDHTLYVMKDSSANDGLGAVVGILKIGRKKLFVYSRHGMVHEMEPLCVLDFYVHESRQRMGCGRKLFDSMLQDQGVRATHLAIDKPSFKFSQFLHKHYNLRAEIPQVNNFVVFEGFFADRPEIAKKKSPQRRPPVHPSKQMENPDEGVRRANTYGGYGLLPMYPGSQQPLAGPSSRPNSGTRSRSSSVQSNNQKEVALPTDYQRNGQLRPISATKDETSEPRVVSAQALKTTGQQMYNRHISESPAGNNPGSRPGSNTRQPGPSGLNNMNQNATAVNRESPLLQRSPGGANSYLENFNMHRDYQARQGRMKVSSANSPHIRNPFLSPEEEVKANYAWPPHRETTNWTVFNKPPGYLTIAQRNYTHTRLW